MNTTESHYIVVAYKLHSIEDGREELVEEATRQRPFKFISRLGMTLDKFENELQDLPVGRKFNFIIPRAEAYGEYEDDQVVDLPRDIFTVEGRFDNLRVREGEVVPMLTDEGQRVNGIVVEVKDEVVVMDFNHPLAGCDLRFSGEVLTNRIATSAEITDAVRMMSGVCGGCSGGNCGEGGCGNGGCGGC